MTRLKLGAAFCQTFLLAYASSAHADWLATLDVDMFTDEVACEIVAAESYNGGFLGMGKRKHVTRTGALYPVIRSNSGGLSIGVKAGGAFPLPPGDIDFRIDRNKAWKIKSSETPKDLVTEVDIPSMPTLQLPNFSEEQQKAYEESMAQMMETIKEASSYSSTYTMTTGDKARHIIREMIAGEELIYRSSTQANMGIELSGFAMLGEAFVLELKKCLPDLVSEVKDATSGDSSINP
jgi:hypothetical protein